MSKKSVKKQEVKQAEEIKNDIKDFDFEVFGNKVAVSKSKYIVESADEIASKLLLLDEHKVFNRSDGYVSINSDNWEWALSGGIYGAVPVWIYEIISASDEYNLSGVDPEAIHEPDNV